MINRNPALFVQFHSCRSVMRAAGPHLAKHTTITITTITTLLATPYEGVEQHPAPPAMCQWDRRQNERMNEG
jgi:hypothetical protein